jgi:hypothetical protein
MDELQELVTYERIRRLKYRYMRAIDTHDLAVFREVFCEDATVWFGNGTYSNSGIENILGFFTGLLTPGFVTSHIAVHPEIEITGDDTASAIWRVEDTCHFIEPLPTVVAFPLSGGEVLQGAGHYYDEYVRIDGGWRISSSGYVRIYEHIQHPGQQAELIVDPDLGVRR